MKRIFGSERFPREAKRPVVALGNFDGVHLGHARLVGQAIASARARRGTSVVYTFDPHPVKVLSPADCPPMLQTLEQRLAAIEALNVDIAVVESFTAEFAGQDAAAFFQNVIAGRLHASEIIVGYDFTCGLHRQGTVEALEQMGKKRGIYVSVAAAEFAGETLISSTTIRHALEHGDVETAARLLGRPYAIDGKVVPGRSIGRELAARTANIESANELIPKNGIYLARLVVAGEGKAHPSIASIGHNPTFRDSPFTIEAHVIDAEIEIVGRKVALEFLAHMRDQIAFESADDLKKQIAKDIARARELHASLTHDPAFTRPT